MTEFRGVFDRYVSGRLPVLMTVRWMFAQSVQWKAGCIGGHVPHCHEQRVCQWGQLLFFEGARGMVKTDTVNYRSSDHPQ